MPSSVGPFANVTLLIAGEWITISTGGGERELMMMMVVLLLLLLLRRHQRTRRKEKTHSTLCKVAAEFHLISL